MHRHDLSDQNIAQWLYFWFRKTRDWEHVHIKALEHFLGESADRIGDILERTRTAVERLPKPLYWETDRGKERSGRP